MYQFSDKTDNFDFLGPNLPKNEFWCQNFKNLSLDLKSASSRYYEYQFSDKTVNIEYLGPNLPKTGFWGRNSKNLSLDSESASLSYYVHQFSDKTNNLEILGTNLPKNGFWGRNFKNLILDSEWTSPLYHMCQFSVKIGIWFFDLNFGKWPNYVQYFGLNIVDGVAESWVEVDGAWWRWVHSLVIPFDDII